MRNSYCLEIIIQEKFDSLMTNLNSKSLLNILCEKKVISLSERNDLMAQTLHEANQRILIILSGLPMTTFQQFLNALKKTKQNDIYFCLVDPGWYKWNKYYILLHILKLDMLTMRYMATKIWT